MKICRFPEGKFGESNCRFWDFQLTEAWEGSAFNVAEHVMPVCAHSYQNQEIWYNRGLSSSSIFYDDSNYTISECFTAEKKITREVNSITFSGNKPQVSFFSIRQALPGVLCLLFSGANPKQSQFIVKSTDASSVLGPSYKLLVLWLKGAFPSSQPLRNIKSNLCKENICKRRLKYFFLD